MRIIWESFDVIWDILHIKCCVLGSCELCGLMYLNNSSNPLRMPSIAVEIVEIYYIVAVLVEAAVALVV